MEFNYYIVYGNPKWTQGNTEENRKAMEKFAKVLKKHNMELLFYGGSFGTTEGFVYAMKGSWKDYQALFGKADFTDANPIASGQRTNMVLSM
jgi:hypothetical protein